MKNKRIFISILFALAVTFGVSAEETFIGTIRTTMGNPVKGVKAYINNDKKKSVKSDNNGEFKFSDIKPTDTLHIKYDGDIHDIPVEGNKGMYIKITRKPIFSKHVHRVPGHDYCRDISVT